MNFTDIVIYRREDIDKDMTQRIVDALVDIEVEKGAEHGYYNYGTLLRSIQTVGSVDLDMIPQGSLILAVGGDGTYLSACRLAAQRSGIVLGVDLGRRGFLPEVAFNSLETDLRRVLIEGYTTDRTTVTVVNGQSPTPAINEVFVTMPGKYAGEFAVEVDDSLAMKFVGEGLIVNTPTGSTAMAITAGGNIMDPNSDTLQIVPVNAHALHVRPFTISQDSVVNVRVARKPNNEAEIFFDGRSYKTTDDEVKIVRGKSVGILQSIGYDFFERVNEKLFKDIEYSV